MKYKKKKDADQYMFGSLINKGVEGIASALGANDKVAGLIGSGVATATGFIPGMQANLTQGADLVGDIGVAAGDTSGISQSISSIGSSLAPFMSLQNGGQLTEFKNGGIPLGNNLVEQGETMNDQFVFSDRLKINKTLAKEYSLPKKAIGKTFAEVSKMFNDESRPNDPISKRGFEKEVSNLKSAQEAFKQVEGIDQPKSNQMAAGGPTGSLINDEFNFMSVNPSTMDLFNSPYTEPVNQQQVMTEFDNQPVVNTPTQQTTTQPKVNKTVNNQPVIDQTPIQPYGVELLGGGVQPQQPAGPLPPYGNDLLAGNLNGKTNQPAGPSMANGNFLSDGTTPAVNNKTDYSKLLGDAGVMMRYAPVVSEGINLARTAANKPTAKNTSMFNTNQVFNPNLIDAEQINRDVESQGNATRTMIRNNTGGNQGSLMSNLLASQLQTDRSIGQSNIQTDSINNQELARVEGLNYNQAQTNTGKQMQIQDWNDRDLAAWNNQLMDSTSIMGQNIGNVGSDMMNQRMASQLTIDYLMNLLGNVNYKKGNV